MNTASSLRGRSEATVGIPPSHRMFRLLGAPREFAGLAALIALIGLSSLVNAGPTNSPPEPAARPAPASPQELASAHERAGRKREAAVVYEELARTNSVARKVVAGRLVTIYSETGETNKALTWAKEAMRDNPDPQAYLAAVHARLGQFNVAEKVLEKEIAANTNTTRAVTLRWQLAEVLEKSGGAVKAQKALEEAERMAKGTAMEAVARRRLDAAKQEAK